MFRFFSGHFLKVIDCWPESFPQWFGLVRRGPPTKKRIFRWSEWWQPWSSWWPSSAHLRVNAILGRHPSLGFGSQVGQLVPTNVDMWLWSSPWIRIMIIIITIVITCGHPLHCEPQPPWKKVALAFWKCIFSVDDYLDDNHTNSRLILCHYKFRK